MSTRHTLPNRRASETLDIVFWNQRWHFTIGYYRDGRPGEVFVNAAKVPGTDLDAMARDAAILVSLMLQYNVPLDVVAGALTRNVDGSPSSITGAIVDRLK